MHSLQHTHPHSSDLNSGIVHASNWLETHPKAVKHALKVGLVGVAIFGLLNLGVLALQHGRTSAFARVGGKSYGLMSLDDAKKILETEFSGSKLTFNVGGKTVILNAKDSGVGLDSGKTFSVLTEKKGLERLPVVSAFGDLFVSVEPVYEVDQQALASKLAPFVAEKIVPALDARVAIPADSAQPVVITPAKDGSELSAVTAAEQAAEEIEGSDFTFKITGKVLPPKWTESDIKAFMPAIDAARSTSMTLEAGKQKLALTSATLAPMLRVGVASNSLKMTLDEPALKAYLDQQAKVFFTAPIATTTVLKDGTETSRTEGTPGLRLDAAATTKLAISAFESNIQTVAPALEKVEPGVATVRTYSNTDTGLYKLIEDFASSHGGKYRVAAIELAGPGNRSAFYEADKPVATASTYKPFIAYALMQRIEAGTLAMDNSTSNGTVEYCLKRMLIISDNNCASALQSVLGWEAFDQKLQADGFTSTKLNNQSGGNKYSTARDEANMLARIYNHELVSTTSADYIIGLMKQQIYNKGIKAGSRGAVVAAKAGYLGNLTHDIGIVYSPKSTYVLAMLTEGAGGYTNLRLLAGQVYDFYNQ